MSKLVIVESPTKAKTISKFLGKEFKIESSFGHIRDLPKSKMGIDIEKDFEPEYLIPRDKSKHVKELQALAKKADEVILATDEDREGEAIAWHLVHALKLDEKQAKRIVFHEITKTATQKALEAPRHIYLHLVDAQQINVARILKSLFNGGFGDLVEHYSFGLFFIQLQGVHEVPGDCLAFAVLISCENHFVGFFREGLELLHVFRFVARDKVLWFEIFLDINAHFAFRQVPDMTKRGFNLEFFP